MLTRFLRREVRTLRSLLSMRGRLSREGLIEHCEMAFIWFARLGLTSILLALVTTSISRSAGMQMFTALLFFPLALSAMVCLGWICAAGIARRCHDAGLPGWFGLVNVTLTLPGDEGTNAYGPPPNRAS